MAMNAVIGALRVSLGLDTAQFETGLKQVKAQLGGVGKALGALGGLGVFAGVSAGIGAAVGRIEEMRKLSAQLDRALANTGNVARTSAAEVEAFADDLERSTGRAAEEVMAVATNLATFGFDNQTFYRAISLADDMAAAWGGDLRQNIEGVSRALAEPEKGLAMLVKRGITFEPQQKQQIANFVKTNNLAGAQGVIFAALEAQVKGVAAAGFGGLTKATANFHKAIEDLFEAIANGLGVNAGLEIAITGVAAAIDFVTANLGVFARAAGVAGTALATALAPTIWGAMTTAAIVFGKAAIGAIRGIGIAIAANPIGAIVVALATAVSAIFLFRDEIKQVLGVDVAGVIIDIGNRIIGTFVGAFKSIGIVWSKLPDVLGDITISTAQAVIDGVEGMINGAIDLINELIRGARDAFAFVGVDIDELAPVDFGLVPNKWAGAMTDTMDAVKAAMTEAGLVDYIGAITEAIGGAFSSASTAVKGFSDLAGDLPGSGAGKARKQEFNEFLDQVNSMKERMRDLFDTLQSGASSALSGVLKALIKGKDAVGALGDAFGQLGDRLIDMAMDQLIQGALSMLLGAFTGGFSPQLGQGRTGAAVFGGGGGFYGIPGLATGGRLTAGGLVEVGERGRELLNLPDGASVIRHSQADDLLRGGSDDRPLMQFNISGSRQDAAEIARIAREQALAVVQQYQKNPYRR